MAKKEAKLTEIRNLLKEEIEPKLEKLRNEKRNFLEYQQTQIDLEKMSRIIAAYDYTSLSKYFTDQSNYLNQHENRVNALHLEIDKLNHEIQNLNEDLNQAKAKKEENLKTDGNLADLESKRKSIIKRVDKTKYCQGYNLGKFEG